MNDHTPSASLRRQVRQRANAICEYCQCPADYSVQSFECEHIIPIASGGATALENLAYACGGCNRAKGRKIDQPDPDSDQVVSLFNPRQDHWRDHFAWNPDFTLMIGLTAIGRATIAALHLNRPGVINLRRALILANVHPPRMD